MPSTSRTRFPEDPQPGSLLGRAVRARRLAVGISQEELAGRCQLDRTFVSEVDRGLRNPSLSSLLRIAVGLGLPLATLIADVETALASDNAWYADAVRQRAFEDETPRRSPSPDAQ